MVFAAKKTLAFVFMIAALSPAASAQESAAGVYFGYVKAGLLELAGSLRELDTTAKIGIIASLVFIALAIYLRMRDTPDNNFRRARNLHKKAVELHESGKSDEARDFYEKASHYRTKAVEQQ